MKRAALTTLREKTKIQVSGWRKEEEALHRSPLPRLGGGSRGCFPSVLRMRTADPPPRGSHNFSPVIPLLRATPLLILLHPAPTPTQPQRPSRNRDAVPARYAPMRTCRRTYVCLNMCYHCRHK